MALKLLRNSNRIFADLRAADPANALAQSKLLLQRFGHRSGTGAQHDVTPAFRASGKQ